MPLTENDLTEGVKVMGNILESFKDVDASKRIDEDT